MWPSRKKENIIDGLVGRRWNEVVEMNRREIENRSLFETEVDWI